MIRILIADDHEVARYGLRKILERQSGWEVIAEACDGKEAVTKAIETKPNVAILDYAMPLINGAEAIGDQSGTVLVTTGLQAIDEFYLQSLYATDGVRAGTYVFLEVHDTGSGDALPLLASTLRQLSEWLGRHAAEMLSFLRGVDVASHLGRALAGEVSTAREVPYEAPRSARGGRITARFGPWRAAAGAIVGGIGLHTLGEPRPPARVESALAVSLDLDETLDTIVHRARELMAADGALIVSWDGQAPQMTVLRAAVSARPAFTRAAT